MTAALWSVQELAFQGSPWKARCGLGANTVRFFNSQWAPDRTRWSDPGVSPLRAPDLSGLPGALIVTAGHDPCETNRRRMARRPRDAGVDVELRREPGLINNFMLLDEVSRLRRRRRPSRGPPACPPCARPDADAGILAGSGARTARGGCPAPACAAQGWPGARPGARAR